MDTIFCNLHPPLSISPIPKNYLSLQFRLLQSSRKTLKMDRAPPPIPHFPVVQQQRVVVPNKYGEKLVGILHDTGSVEVVIFCHGFRSTKQNITAVNLAATLESEGISAFRFDFSGNGESEGSFQYGNYWREADDLHAIIQYLYGEGRVVSAILGHSKGCQFILYALYMKLHLSIK